jgi:hypothetical protein
MGALLAGLLAVAWVYPTLRRWAVWRWLAVLATLLGLLGALTVADTSAASVALAVPVGAAVMLLSWDSPLHQRYQRAGAALVVAGLVAWRLASDGWPPDSVRPGAAAVTLGTAALLLGLAGVAGAGRAPGALMRWVCLLACCAGGAGLAAGGDLLVSWVWLPGAAALGLTALLRGRRGAGAAVSQEDDVDRATLAAFDEQHPGLRLRPVVIVIAAYDEAAGLPRVLPELPTQACGLPVDVLVVDDGSKDGTAEAARAACEALGRGYVVACPANRGQGRALRLGYRIAREHGASYVVTTDADGQYSPAEIPAVLAPVVEDRADFVTGSRRLGSLENKDRVRQAGTYVFAWLASALLGRHITDTSFGLRAMRAGLTAAVTLNQPQYQASELLVGVFSHGFRYAEVPGTMRVRSAGSSKKGGNLAYGSRYARVLLGTWWREGCPRPVAEVAPALRDSARDVPVDVPA